MKIFKFNKKEDGIRSMSDVYEDLFDECDRLVDSLLKATDTSIEDLLSGMDEETGRIFGASMASLRKVVDLAAEQAAIIDRQTKKLDELTKLNEKLLKNTELLLAKAKKD